MRPTIRDISRMTGFSPATVSNALNGKKGVNEDTTRKVRKAARELGYFEEPAAGRTRIRLVLFRAVQTSIEGTSALSGLLIGVQEACADMGYELTVQYLDKNDPDFVRNAKALAEDGKTPMIIAGDEFTDLEYTYFENSKAPLILVGYWNAHMKHSAVIVDHEQAVGSMIDYLAGKGHRRIGHLKCRLSTPTYIAREIWYLESLKRNGLDYDEDYTVVLEPGLEASYGAMKQYLKTAHTLPTAFFADSDEIALGAMKALQEAGYQVPGQVSVSGFGDIPFAEIASPGLSSIHFSQKEIGQTAVQYLARIVRDPMVQRSRVLVSSQLVARNSVRELTEA